MKRLVAVLTKDLVEGVVEALVRQGVHGVTMEPASSDALAGNAGDGSAGDAGVRLEVVVENHRADDVIESVEAVISVLDSAERVGALPRLVVENVEAVVHIRSGRIIT